VAKAFLAGYGVVIRAWTSSAAGIDVPGPETAGFDLAFAEENFLRVPHRGAFEEISAKIERLRAEGDSAGGVVSCVITGVPPGLGEPVFDKLDARLASAMLSLGAAKGVEFGSGFASAYGCGSSLNDQPVLPPGAAGSGGLILPPTAGGFALSAVSDADDNRYDSAANPAARPLSGVSGEKKAVSPADARPAFKTNNAGGILGGIANGMPVEFRVAFKPVASISKKQAAVDREGKTRELVVRGRHDVCIAPRAVPVVEAMAALVLADMVLLSRGNR
jgi:chorismate synthase